MPSSLTFLSWTRERVADLVTGTEQGRLLVSTSVTLTGRGPDDVTITNTAAGDVRFLLTGPQDVVGLKPGAIVGRYPAPGAIDAETDKCSHIELADPALPWRYTPASNPPDGTGNLHTWLALVVGTEDELTVTGQQVTLGATVQALHTLAGPSAICPFAHVQHADGHRIARLLSRRPLTGGLAYVAVLVPTYRQAGSQIVTAWDGSAPVTLPVFDTWRFRTATPAGSFPILAERLRPGDADPETGRAPALYPYGLDTALKIRGALAPVRSSDDALDSDVASDLVERITPDPDPLDRPVIGPPGYGEAWGGQLSTWSRTLNGDPRHRGAAGLGLELGIRLQETLVEEAREHAGAQAVAAQRLAYLSLGLAASGALWAKRLPSDALRRLWLLGPALRRVVTPDGPVADLATAPGRALPRGVFSTAVRRALRLGPARTALAAQGSADPAEVLKAANRCRQDAQPSQDGVPSFQRLGVSDFDERRWQASLSGEIDPTGAVNGLGRLDLSGVPSPLRSQSTTLRQRLLDAAGGGRLDLAWGRAIETLTAATRVDAGDERAVEAMRRRLAEVLATFPDPRENLADLIRLIRALEEDIPESDCRLVDLESLADSVVPLFDPTAEDAPARVRVLGTIDGLDPSQPLTPPEVCVGLPRPVWRDLNDNFAEWLLPGVGELKDNTVIALETNPVFTDAFLLGYNTQLLTELRWRNMPVAAGCTPLRVFWERANTGSGERIDDIIGVANWPDASDLGAAAHRPGGASGTDLVLVFRGQLFLRYPKTLLYLVSAKHAGQVRFDLDPPDDAARVLPSFQGRIGADVTFFGFQGFQPDQIETHWVVLEEPPTGYRFYNKPLVGEPPGGPIPGDGQPVPANADGALYADQAFAEPVRVLIAGNSLTPQRPSPPSPPPTS
ncbi:hypothetical protein [Streptosporangium carneum]|uniref:Uncharacterized protein n=1 Tax=Streptosporangium carneum TaxID=47481 RepID=A0A9W6HW34_9ACTN|nr:hypothetical protein [Streptosporangium carneum]GLK07382.1 hypothetical protein GCM10017600_07870 [Streptosporangium carneum]